MEFPLELASGTKVILFPFNWLNLDGENELSKGEAVDGEVTGGAGGGKGEDCVLVSVLDSLLDSSIMIIDLEFKLLNEMV